MTRANASSPSKARTKDLPRTYLQRSELPLASLILLLPLIIIYELGTFSFTPDGVHQVEQRIIAFTLMQRFFEFFGATGKYLPALAIVGILLTWHIARNDPWRVSPTTLLGMFAEGVAWGLPLLALGTLCARYFAHHHFPLAGSVSASPSTSLFVLSIGAGIYEELVFRLIAMTCLHLLLVDLLKVQRLWAYLAMVVASSVAFAFYHYLGYEQFTWRSFAFRSVAGIYFGLLFLTRGFGVTSVSHASYDIIVVLLRFGGGA